ncbi:tRNA pseudouridine synthase B isoform 2 [Galdieria sulphuraria]|uniref:tRNA pseudouridine(55) synthase n=1 Tax=Galdieria sulphuraria TaxID=130081 RepID=M2Y067_GALSU|nr:tRNA pseudouridine synthase B isoform 2 [Galdieria sulphuraria]EME29283.1 tRNA pseudouridine synthase B isoform 2 [Galdieria sulphuraria]|eukprot:XP_005705803.1 tRNA pseudouridine synthase B isoform 2 [Galdieria sulphuraria]
MRRLLFLRPFPVQTLKKKLSIIKPRFFCSVHSPSTSLSGIFPVRKPLHYTSFDVVKQIRSIILQDYKNSGKPCKWIKVGHGGTLDPFATGVLVIAVGSTCSQLERFLQGSKRYRATLKFGEETDTLDNTGTIVDTKPVPNISIDDIRSVLPRYMGVIEQVPPAYSAIHVNGKRAYEWARKGVAIELPKRKVRIDHIECTYCCMPIAEFSIECSGGTYIRRLLSDIVQQEWQTVGHLT